MGGLESLIIPVVEFFTTHAAAITAGTAAAKTGYDVVAGNTALQEGKAAAYEAQDKQEEALLAQLGSQGQQDKIASGTAGMTDPVLSSFLGGGSSGSSSTDLLMKLLQGGSGGGNENGLQ